MLPEKLQELWEELEKARGRTLEMAGRLSEAEFALRVDGEWSVAEIVEHLLIAETGTSKVIRKCLKESAGRLPPYPADDSVLAVRHPSTAPGNLAIAPQAAIPKGGAGKEELLAQAASTRAQTRVSLEMLAGADPRAAKFPHPSFGDLDLYEWPCLLVLEHEKQHHGQIAGILRKLGR
jgi:uncharacterized damage-inducible protein DinB